MTTHTKSYVATNREVKLSIGGKNYSKNLIGGTVSDSDITSGGIVFTSGSFELAGYDPSGVPIVESKINLGDLVTINVMFTDSNGASYVAPHPRTNLYVVNFTRNFTSSTITVEVACRLSVIRDFGTNDNDEVRGYITQLSGIDNILEVCEIERFDIDTLDSALQAIGSYAFMAYGNFTVQKWSNISNGSGFTTWSDFSSISVEDLQDALIPPVTLSLEAELETPGYPEEDPDDEDRDSNPEACQRTSECESGEICVDGYCQPVDCTDNTCPPGHQCGANNLCEQKTCSGEADCPTGFICVDGRCEDSYCGADGQCPTDYVCVDKVCQLIDCSGGQSCPDGYTCVDGSCAEIECLDDRYCRRSGGICVDGKCVTVDCTEDSDCGDGYQCVDNECYLLPSFCDPDGSDCASDEVCVDGQCHVKQGDCTIDSDCGEGFTCVDGACIEDEEEDEEEEEDDVSDEVLEDVQFVQTKRYRLAPLSECLQIRTGKFTKEEIRDLDAAGNNNPDNNPLIVARDADDLTTTPLRCGVYVNPTVRSETAQKALEGAGGGGDSTCITEIAPDKLEEALGIDTVYGYKAEGSLKLVEEYFSDNIERKQDFKNEGPGRQLSYEKQFEEMSVWRASDSNITAVIDEFNTGFEIRVEAMQELAETINEYGQMRDDNDPSKIKQIAGCIDNLTLLKMHMTRDFYDCLMGDAQIRFEQLRQDAVHIYNTANNFLNDLLGARVTTNIQETKNFFGEAGEVTKKEVRNLVHSGASFITTRGIKEIRFTPVGAIYIGPDIIKALTLTRRGTPLGVGIEGYEHRFTLKSETVDLYEYGVGTVKHTNKKLDHENPLNNTTHIVLSSDNSSAPEAPSRNVPKDERFSDIDFDGIPDSEDDDIDGDGILNQNDPDPERFTSDIDGDGIADVNDDDIDGDDVPNELDPSPTVSDADGPDKDGDGKPNILDDDIDGDGFKNEDDPDMDGDGIPNDDDADIDGDGYSNSRDPDMDGDGTINSEDSNPRTSFTDTDDDGTPDATDTDDDNDGLEDTEDPNPLVVDLDTDGDGLYDFEDPDIDNDGLLNENDPDPETPAGDIDGDGLFDYEDDDIDGDGILNADDPNPNVADTQDTDSDGTPDVVDDDIDGDGLPNAIDPRPTIADADEDGDGVADVDDDDIDGDGIPNTEDPDADGDGVPAYADADDLDPEAQFLPGQELKQCNVTTEEYKVELSITITGNETSIANIKVGGTEELSFPLPFLPLVPENIKALSLDQSGDPKFMSVDECDATATAFRQAASARLAAIEKVCSAYMASEAMKYKLRGNSMRIVETMRPELFMWRPVMPITVTSKGKTIGRFYSTATTWGFDQYNMVVSIDLIGYSS